MSFFFISYPPPQVPPLPNLTGFQSPRDLQLRVNGFGVTPTLVPPRASELNLFSSSPREYYGDELFSSNNVMNNNNNNVNTPRSYGSARISPRRSNPNTRMASPLATEDYDDDESSASLTSSYAATGSRYGGGGIGTTDIEMDMNTPRVTVESPRDRPHSNYPSTSRPVHSPTVR